ncbi:survival of motor neuron-related-splicing factor [Anaeramoeba flamelloides]|uniref:Survival of motor neuron-related-splicing factor n=1 Tax=Anaeramoeba flamelloides TaxID=1746091 RepID=A0AAV7Y9U5_9EUKA|nr:survival of motor neuron-related-splicing factor [Anaeramoeba flamelloides]
MQKEQISVLDVLQSNQSLLKEIRSQIEKYPDNVVLKTLQSKLLYSSKLVDEVLQIQSQISKPIKIDKPASLIKKTTSELDINLEDPNLEEFDILLPEQLIKGYRCEVLLDDDRWYSCKILSVDFSNEKAEQDKEKQINANEEDEEDEDLLALDNISITVDLIGYPLIKTVEIDQLRKTKKPNPKLFTKGTRGQAIFSGDGMYYDCAIEDTLEEGKVIVVFDGNVQREIVSIESIRHGRKIDSAPIKEITMRQKRQFSQQQQQQQQTQKAKAVVQQNSQKKKRKAKPSSNIHQAAWKKFSTKQSGKIKSKIPLGTVVKQQIKTTTGQRQQRLYRKKK